jgi:hypothetical protein
MRLKVVGICAHCGKSLAYEIVASPAALSTVLEGNEQALVKTSEIRARYFVKAEPIGQGGENPLCESQARHPAPKESCRGQGGLEVGVVLADAGAHDRRQHRKHLYQVHGPHDVHCG